MHKFEVKQQHDLRKIAYRKIEENNLVLCRHFIILSGRGRGLGHEALTERAALKSSSPHIAFVKDLRLLFSLKHMNNYSAMYAQTEKGLA